MLTLVKGENERNIVLQMPQRDSNHQSNLISPSGVKVQYSQSIKTEGENFSICKVKE
jgi:hypothetical protein